MENVSNTTNFSSTVHTIKQNHVEGPLGKAISAAAHEKNAVRKAEISSGEVTINTSEKPAELLLKTAVEGINEVLGENTISATYDAEIDLSTEAITQNIVSSTTAAYPQYVENNPGISGEDSAQSFIDAINIGMTNAVEDAKSVLSGLDALDENKSSMIDTTYDAVMQGIQSFFTEA